MKEKNNNSAEV